MSIRIYMLIGLAVGVIIFLLGYVADDNIIEFAEKQQWEANRRGMPAVADIVFKPVQLIFEAEQESRPAGAIIAGVAWPAVGIWIVFIIIGILVIAGVDATGGIDAGTPDF